MKKKILAEALGSDWIKDKASTIFPFLWSRGFPSPHLHREGPQSREGVKGRKETPVNSPETLKLASIMAEGGTRLPGRPLSQVRFSHKQDDWPETTWRTASVYAI